MKSDFQKGSSEGSDIIMEPRTGTPIEKWDEVNGNVQAPTQIAGAERDTNVMPMVTGDISQGERFTKLRESTGMNRKDFAEYLDIPYRTMQDWERDVRTMPSYVFSLIEYKVRTEFGIKLPQELDPNTIGNVRKGLEDQVEQNDNNLDGIINNVVNVIDDNANGIPDEDEKSIQELEAERDELARDYYEAQENLELYMLSSGGESDYSDSMTADVKEMGRELKDLESRIEKMKENGHTDGNNNVEKTSLLKMLHDCKAESDDRPYRERHLELEL